jgi:ParB-like nuclease domain
MADSRVNQSIAKTPDSIQSARDNEANQRIEIVQLGRLATNKGNARTHSKKQIGQIARSIERFGFINPIVIDDADQIIAGHGRYEAARRLNIDSVPVLRVSHLTTAERKAYALADNRLAELATWDRDLLATELQGLIDLDFDVALTGFDIGDVDIIVNYAHDDRGESADAGDEIPEPHHPVSRVGDQWLLGEHQLLCSNAKGNRAYAAVDAAIQHWQKFTGKAAMLADTGKTLRRLGRNGQALRRPVSRRRQKGRLRDVEGENGTSGAGKPSGPRQKSCKY